MKIFNLISATRQKIMLTIRPMSKYRLGTRELHPISSRFGFDRGTPIDRFWIDEFISQNSEKIKGRVLEIDDSRYGSVYKDNITQMDILDINPKNKKANIHGDLRNLKGKIKDNTYDCVILTQVLGMIDDLPKAVSEIHRIIKPGGFVLVTASSLSPVHDEEHSFWRFTKASLEFLFKGGFTTDIKTFGNVFASQCFWVGLSKEELTDEQLSFNDKRYPCIVTLIGKKKI